MRVQNKPGIDAEPDGLTNWVSSYDMAETLRRIRAAVASHGMVILAHIDHAAAATEVGKELRPTELLIFGDPQVGTNLMQVSPTIGIDLPLRMLAWMDDSGTTWVAYNEPGWIAARHGARSGTDRVLGAMRKALAAIADKATRREPGTPP